jgi:opacity protein-like surface antigen
MIQKDNLMHKLLFAVALCLLCAGGAAAQKVSSETGYYPAGYHGDAWAGEVTSVNEDTREFTLTSTKKDKTKTFVGVLSKGYRIRMKNGSSYKLKMSDLSGLYIKAYYIEREKKENGQKVKWNEVIQIRFLEKGE